jgi:isopenicillin N synthase-like dioxygenase
MLTPSLLTHEPVVIEYQDLVNPNVDLSMEIEKAFGNGQNALGILLIRGVPNYPLLRENLLKLAPVLASLPKDRLSILEDPGSRYMFGWSSGKEMVNGKLDTSKASFCANPLYDVPTDDMDLKRKFPEYCHSNIWPADLPDFKIAFKSLGQLMADTGKLVAYKCDKFLLKFVPEYEPGYLYKTLKKSRSVKARLLHYFPKDEGFVHKEVEDSWCGLHLDHSTLTALTRAMYMVDNTGDQLVKEPENSGLFIKTRAGNVVKVDIPADCLAFQTGEALQVSSRGNLIATPHFVSAGKIGPGISRNTLALFLQPDWDQELLPGYSFTKFTDEILKNHYGY